MQIKNLTLGDLGILSDYDPDSMPVEQARELIKYFLVPLDTQETVPLRAALQRTLACDVPSPIAVPPHDYSSMDGYALSHADLHSAPTKLRLIGKAYAGHPFADKVATGECVRIMTGALIPHGCDTVVIQEHVRADNDSIEIGAGHTAGQNIRRVGEDIALGTTVLACGQRVRPVEMGLLASLGLSEVSVYRKLRVAIFSSGDELQQPGSPLAPGHIYDSNRHTLFGMLSELGADVLDMGNVGDDKERLKQTLLEAAARADVIITSGGVSVGEADYIRPLLAEIGEIVFWKIAMKPGRPLAYGKIGASHFFGLPGNPVAVMVTFQQFVRDALCHLMGQLATSPIKLSAVCSEAIKKAPGRTEFQRGILTQGDEGGLIVRTTGAQGSGILSSMSLANCYIVLPLEQGNVEAGTRVVVQPF